MRNEVTASSAAQRKLDVQLPYDGESLQGSQFLTSSMVGKGLDVRTGAATYASAYSALLAAVVFLGITATLAFVAQLLSARRTKFFHGGFISQLAVTRHGEDKIVLERQQFLNKVDGGLLLHLRTERPFHAPKATTQTPMTECALADFIQKHFERDSDSMLELERSLDQRASGEAPANGWWSWTHPDPLSKSMSQLMAHFQCDGLMDWSRVSSSVLAHTFMQIVVTSGLGSEAMLHEGSDADWLESLHRDIFWDWSSRGLKHLFFSKVDTFLVGCVGRKRVVLLPPDALPARALSTFPSWKACDETLQALRQTTRDEGWTALEEYAKEAGGDAFTVCPGTYCHIPSGWWHIVRPLDDLTVALSPSFLRGSWNEKE